MNAVLMKTHIKTSRRTFVRNTASGFAALATWSTAAFAADRTPAPKSYLSKAARMKLGTVTYNLAKDWDI